MKTITWENKGIVLGIIIYILNHHKKLKNRVIIIANDRYKYILKTLFPKIKFRLYDKNDTKNKLVINVRNNNKDGLIINNINNLNEIKGKKPTLLPWYDRHNPIIMFKYDEGKIKDLDKLKKKIDKFTEDKRMEPHGEKNFIEELCKIRIWDTFFEHYILYRLWLKFGYSKVSTYEFISDVLTEEPCYIKPGLLQPLFYPIIFERRIEVPVVRTLIREVEKEVEKIKEKPEAFKDYKNMVNLLNQKMKILNIIIEKKI